MIILPRFSKMSSSVVSQSHKVMGKMSCSLKQKDNSKKSGNQNQNVKLRQDRPGSKEISSIMAKVEMAKSIHVYM